MQFGRRDYVIYEGVEYEIVDFGADFFGSPLVELRTLSGTRITVLLSEVRLSRRYNPGHRCECGQIHDKAFSEGKWHSDWCPLYYKGNK